MIRVLQVVGRMDRAGAESMIMNLYRVLDRSKFQFDFLYFTDEHCDFDVEIEELGGQIYRITASNVVSRFISTVKLLLKQRKWPILHSHMLFGSMFHLMAARISGIPMRVAHSHSTQCASSERFFGKLYQTISRLVIRYAATNQIACGQAAASYLFPGRQDVLVLPNAINVEQFVDIGERNKSTLRNELKLSNDCLVIVQVGRFLPVKNHKFSLDIANELNKSNINFCLAFAGRGELESEIKLAATNSGFVDKIHFLGIRSDIPEIMAGSDVMLMPSLYEGFPVVLVESQAIGLPAIVSDTVSFEVDLGLGLVKFQSLKVSANAWADKIIEIAEQNEVPKHVRISKMKLSGFDTHENVRKLELLYSRI